MKAILFVVALAACGSKGSEAPPAPGGASGGSAAPEPASMPTPTTLPPKHAPRSGTVEVMVDGQPATISKATARLDLRGNQLTLDFQLGAPPFPKERQMSIFIKNWSKQTGPITNATAQWARIVDDTKEGETLYGVRTEGGLKLTIDKFDPAPEKPAGSTALMIKVKELGTVDGTFEGDLACESCLGPKAKAPFAAPVHLTAGKFTGVPIIQY